MNDRQFVLENLHFRMSEVYRGRSVNVGTGNPYGKLVIVHHAHTIPERDGTTGALKRFELLDEAYRVPAEVVEGLSQEENRIVLKELLEILKPLLIVTSGQGATEMVKNKALRSFKSQSGREFAVEDLTTSRFYAILNPEEYSFARAPTQLKERGRIEWEGLAELFNDLYTNFKLRMWGL